MPSIKDFEKNKKAQQAQKNLSAAKSQGMKTPPSSSSHVQSKSKPSTARRPGRDPEELKSTSHSKIKVVDVESADIPSSDINISSNFRSDNKTDSQDRDLSSSATQDASHLSTDHSHEEELNKSSDKISGDTSFFKSEKRKITFPGSENFRKLQPDLFEIAESIYNDWLDEKDFSELPIENEQIKKLIQQGLQQAKGYEKKILESPLTEKILTQVLTIAFKAQEKYKNFESKWKK